MKNTALFNEDHSATYCPEDDKLRLYVGRVPREEYDALRAEGWQATAKQDCDFSAVWTTAREDTALAYAGTIDDEDQAPADRAADRAERFAGYREGNLTKATDDADRYDAGPTAHGYQSKARAVRSADRHDRQAGRAVNSWDKAEYWQTRTSGVIGNALYKSSPGVRMGRIKTIEAELRKAEKARAEWVTRWERVAPVAADPSELLAYFTAKHDEAERRVVDYLFGSCFQMVHPRNGNPARRYVFELMGDPDPVTLAEFCAHWQACNPSKPSEDTRHLRHLRNRIAYEMQMVEAQGGRAASVEMVVGGFIGGHQIRKVNKSNATGRVVSVAVKAKGKNRWDNSGEGWHLAQVATERLAVGSYRAPTPEDLANLAATIAEEKAAAPAKAKAPGLINPTPADAERLQALVNEARKNSAWHSRDEAPKEICEIDQATYSKNSGGTYSKCETREFCALGESPERSNMYSSAKEARNARIGPVLCKLRMYGDRVVVLTDKPQKPIPPAMWKAAKVAKVADKVEA